MQPVAARVDGDARGQQVVVDDLVVRVAVQVVKEVSLRSASSLRGRMTRGTGQLSTQVEPIAPHLVVRVAVQVDHLAHLRARKVEHQRINIRDCLRDPHVDLMGSFCFLFFTCDREKLARRPPRPLVVAPLAGGHGSESMALCREFIAGSTAGMYLSDSYVICLYHATARTRTFCSRRRQHEQHEQQQQERRQEQRQEQQQE